MAKIGKLKKLEVQDENGKWIDITHEIVQDNAYFRSNQFSHLWGDLSWIIVMLDYWHWMCGDSNLRNN